MPAQLSDDEPTVIGLAPGNEPLNRLDRIGLIGLAAVFVLLSGLVQTRSAFLPRRLGDWNVFARAAWAARTGGDLYGVTDDNGFHYLYPPTFAILLAPLADAPPEASHAGLLAYPVTVLYWYYFNLACLALAAHWLATAVEEVPLAHRRASRRWDLRWWSLRVWPGLACLPPIGHTLVRGQVGVLLLLCLSGTILALVRGRSGWAGVWLACAICLKVIPALLLAYPLYRRDTRFLAGCAAALLAGLVAIPVAVRGPRQTWNDYRRWNQVMLAPSLARGGDTSRAAEVLNVTATDSQSFLAMFHNTLFLDRATRPKQAAPTVRLAAAAASGILLLAWLALARRSSHDDAASTVLLWGALIEVMLLASPVCHLHYFCLSVPLTTGLFAVAWQRSAARLSKSLWTLVAANVAANAAPHFPGMELWRDVGLAGYAALALFVTVAVVLWRRPGHAEGSLAFSPSSARCQNRAATAGRARGLAKVL